MGADTNRRKQKRLKERKKDEQPGRRRRQQRVSKKRQRSVKVQLEGGKQGWRWWEKTLQRENTQFWSGPAWKKVPDCSPNSRETLTGSKVSAEVKSTNYTVTFSLYILQLVTSVFAFAKNTDHRLIWQSADSSVGKLSTFSMALPHLCLGPNV